MNSHYRKNRDLIDYDYLDQLSEADLDYLESFTAAYYNGSPSDEIEPEEAAELNGRRRRDAYGALERVDIAIAQITEQPAYRSPRADARKRRKKRERRSA